MYGINQWQPYGGSSVSPAIAMIDGAVVKAHSDLLSTGESVSAWSVANAALVMLNAVSFESLGFHMQSVPSLNRLMLTESKVNSFIHCFVGVQKITSLHDLEMAICESEGVNCFEELKLGPILKHPLVVDYFSVAPDVTEICKITSEQVVAYLNILPRKDRKPTDDDLLGFIAKRMKKKRGHLCIRIQSLAMHIGYIIRGRQSEGTLLKKCNDGLDVQLILDNNGDDASDDENDAKDDDSEKNNDAHDSNLFSSLNTTASASDTSAAAQTPQVWLDTKLDCSLTSHESFNDCVAPPEGKRMSNITFCTKFVRTPKRLQQQFQNVDVETGFIDDNAIDGHTWRFIKVWKDLCEKEENADEVVGKMLDFYYPRIAPTRKNEVRNQMTASYPHLGLLNVAIASIKFGLWDRMSSSSQASTKEVAVNACAIDVIADVKPAEENTLAANKHVLEGSVGFIDDNAIDGHTWRFIKIWKDSCEKEENVVKVFDAMLDYYHPQMNPIRKSKILNKMTISYPHVGFLNVAITSIKFGLWDRMISSQANSKEVPLNTCAVDGNTDVKLAEENPLVANKNVLDGNVGFIDDNAIDGLTWSFIKIWKNSCEKGDSVLEVFNKMLDFYHPQITSKRKVLRKMTVLYPHVGLLNVAIASIKFGLWDCVSSFQANGKEVAVVTCAVDVDADVEPAEENTLVANKHVLEGSVGFIDGHTWKFIKIWKELCEKEENVVEVFDKMVDFYHPRITPKRKSRVLKKMIVPYPHVELLNVAIASLKFGLWDRISSSQANDKEVAVDTCVVDVNEDVDPAEGNTLIANKHVLEGSVGIALEEVLKHIKAYFVSPDYVSDNVTSYPRKQMIFLREIRKLEGSLTQNFSVSDFETLGFGDIFTFLAEHISILPTTWQKWFIVTEKPEKPLVKVCMSQHYLLELLSQAANNLGENETLSKLMVSELLRMQFPSAGLTLLEDEFTEEFLATRSKNSDNDNVNSNAVLFSSTLTDFRAEKDFSNTHVFTNDAVELLLSAPMLVDLSSWSSWDLKFAPSLGPLVGWLLSYVSSKELLCLVTKDGKVLRIDHLATVDSFLDAFLHGSSFEAALKLISLISLYGGVRNVPLSLLKCHAKNGFEIMFKTSSSIASRFVLDCLGYLPIEFRSFAGELLVSVFRSITKDAYMAILSECNSKKDHMIIHELGFSLGIVEWFDDRCSIFSESKDSVENKRPFSENEVTRSLEFNQLSVMSNRVHSFDDSCIQPTLDSEREKNAANIIESIRVQEFGLDPNISSTENSILEKQHARLGRALFCLSQELYSQDSHFLLELVQNADDNAYPRNVEPTLTFILQEKSIVVLNNEHGFSAENIRALCDVGSSTKKASSAGYIGKKGIGFKSVFRVTDAPEVHSNGFHIKFDLTEGQIGFVLPTIVPPCDINFFTSLVSSNITDQMISHHYNTCLVLPLRSTSKSKLTETSTIDNITSMFSDLHPSLLLFLHRLQCIKFRNMLTDSFIIMKKEKIGNGLTNVSVGNDTLTWFADSLKLQANGIRKDVKFTEISIALALEVLENGSYIPKLDQQYAFAFLPLRTYGLKFIIQGDFILPSSREEVDGDSPWNQWLLSEFPNLFVKAEMSFCSLPGFNNCLGKAVSVFLSYVPLVGEVHGFFSQLPRMIIHKLCTSNCLLLEGENDKWVPPCRVLRNWNEQARILLPDSLIYKHLGLGYLNKEIVLSDTLARALGIEIYGPKILVNILSDLCHTKEGLDSMGLSWLSSWLNELYPMSFQNPVDFKVGSNIMNTLTKTPFIPLIDGSYGSINEGMIWMNLDGSWNSLEAFTRLFANLRIVNPALFHGSETENITQMLSKLGVEHLSSHQLLMTHVLPAMCDQKNTVNIDLMIEYLLFIMVHLQCTCSDCFTEREHIISEVYSKAFILTNHGFVIPSEVAIHFNNDFGNHIDISRLINGIDIKWYEVDKTYLTYGSLHNWRNFLKEVGVTDFVQTVQVEKTVPLSSRFFLTNMMWEKVIIPPGSTVSDWESHELVELLAKVSLSGDREKCKYLLEVFDDIWDDYFSDKVDAICNTYGDIKPFKSSIVSAFDDVKWVLSSLDDGLYYPKGLFYNCEAVCVIFGNNAPYAVPKIRSAKLVTSIGFKTTVTLHDALYILEMWNRSTMCFKASISQMSRFYSFIWKELVSSDQKSMTNLSSKSFIFVPLSSVSSSEVVSGVLLSPQEAYWHDNIINKERKRSKMLCNIYPSFRHFFVNECGVKENPPLLEYFAFLRQLSTANTPLEAAKKVFDIFVMWSDGIKSGVLSSEDIEVLKRKLKKQKMKVLPTARDKWVSLHSSFGLVCWCDDEKLANEFEELNNINFFYLCELTDEEKEMLEVKVSFLMKNIGIPALSEVVTREAIYDGPVDNRYKVSLVSWVLPYAQRYISNTYPERYHQLKLSGSEKINRLQIVVVEILYFQNVIKRSGLTSKKRHDTICLLQDEILYATYDSDSHSVFMELSRFLINGDPEIHLANFLHVITTMAESGSTEDQIERFILNSQKVPKLSDDEPILSIQSLGVMSVNTVTTNSFLQINRNWPPSGWQTSPKFISSLVNDLKMQDDDKRIDQYVPTIDEVEIIEASTSLNHVGQGGTSVVDCVSVEHDLVDQDGSLGFSQKNLLSHGSVNRKQAFLTGRRGEELAFNYYKNMGIKVVKWVNEASETGLPYDIEVCDDENRKEYIEVKTTNSKIKDWFEISVREWQFAVENGESFSIARVVLLGDKRARVAVFKNPARLCQRGELKLAVLMSKKQKDEFVLC